MWAAIKAKVEGWFVYSETILWARLQVFVGVVWSVLAASDLSPLLNPKWMTWWLIFSGVVTEYLRRRGTEIRNGVIRSLDTIDKPGPV